MNRVQKQIDELTSARDEIMECLKDGPLRTGDLLERLGYSGMNFLLTQSIGDRAGEWDNSPHQLAQSDMIDDGTLVWWRDDVLDVWYGLPSQCPYAEHGDASPINGRITAYLDEVCILAGAVPRYDAEGNNSGIEGPLKWAAPFITVREIDGAGEFVSVAIKCRNSKGVVEISCYDYATGAGMGDMSYKFPWPETIASEVAAKIPDALKESHDYFRH